MAEDKKGFILYADQIDLFTQLPNDKAGELIKHIFAYVNDEDPKTDDLIINIAFTPIKKQFKRDLEKWETTRKGRSKAGKASAEARRLKKQQELTKSTNVKSVEQNPTNPTVKVNVTVTDINIHTPPTLTEFLTYCVEHIATDRSEYLAKKQSAILKYKSWDVDDWHKTINGKRTKIKNWKQTIYNTWKWL